MRVIVYGEGDDMTEISHWTEPEQLVLRNEARDAPDARPAAWVYVNGERSMGRHGTGLRQAALAGDAAVFRPVFQPATGEVYAKVSLAATGESLQIGQSITSLCWLSSASVIEHEGVKVSLASREQDVGILSHPDAVARRLEKVRQDRCAVVVRVSFAGH